MTIYFRSMKLIGPSDEGTEYDEVPDLEGWRYLTLAEETAKEQARKNVITNVEPPDPNPVTKAYAKRQMRKR